MSPNALDAALQGAILGVVAERRGVDFRDYRPERLVEAIHARMGALGRHGQAYLATLRQDADEAARLAETILVSHTSFFRDPPVFEALARRVVPALVAGGELLRAWVVGAATGEEAFSVAIVLHEALGAFERFEVLATDVDDGVLAFAREARYPGARLEALSSERRERYFRTRGADDFEVVPELRSRVRFVRHDVVGPTLAPGEAILARFHLVCCRNVLLWFDPRLRSKAVERLKAVLTVGGALVLGHAERLPPATTDLRPAPGVDSSLRIWVRGAEG